MLLLKNPLLPCLKMASLFSLKFPYLRRTLQDRTVSAHTTKILNARTVIENKILSGILAKAFSLLRPRGISGGSSSGGSSRTSTSQIAVPSRISAFYRAIYYSFCVFLAVNTD